MNNPVYTIAVEFGAAGKIMGAELGAPILKKSIIDNFSVIDGGSITANDGCTADSSISEQLMKISRDLSCKVHRALNLNNKCFCIGGDHSIALGSITGATKWAADNSKRIGVIYIDAHTDCNVPETSNTGNLHGMPIAFAMGYGNCILAKVAEHPLSPNSIMYIGTRSIDKPEFEFIKKHNITVVTSKNINETSQNLNAVYEVIAGFIEEQKIDVIHLSVDIDAVDPQFAPGTGVPEADGISTENFQSIITHIIKSYNVISADFVEYNPLLDINTKTLNICSDTCKKIVELL